MSESTNDL